MRVRCLRDSFPVYYIHVYMSTQVFSAPNIISSFVATVSKQMLFYPVQTIFLSANISLLYAFSFKRTRSLGQQHVTPLTREKSTPRLRRPCYESVTLSSVQAAAPAGRQRTQPLLNGGSDQEEGEKLVFEAVPTLRWQTTV